MKLSLVATKFSSHTFHSCAASRDYLTWHIDAAHPLE
jgi:hypothetical protein